jgi:hypothetical protein
LEPLDLGNGRFIYPHPMNEWNALAFLALILVTAWCIRQILRDKTIYVENFLATELFLLALIAQDVLPLLPEYAFNTSLMFLTYGIVMYLFVYCGIHMFAYMVGDEIESYRKAQAMYKKEMEG